MDKDLKYWNGRYKRIGGKRTVGRMDWTEDEYNAFIQSHEPFLRSIVGKFCNHNTQNVLDFGCGIARWRHLFFEFNYFGTDIVDFIIQENKQKFPGVAFETVNNNIIPFGDQKFDVIWTFVTLQHIVEDAELQGYIDQFHNRLRPDGIVIVTENMLSNKNNTYIKFRSIDEYIKMFMQAGFVLGYKEQKIKFHPTAVFRKM